MSIPIIYASTSGNVESVCERISDVLRSRNMEVSLHRAEASEIDLITNNQVLILATSTWDHGIINPFFNKLVKEMKNVDMTGKKVAFVGCGDIRYEPVLFCEGIEILKRLVLEKGGEQIGITLKINGDPRSVLDTLVAKWAEKIGGMEV